MGRGRIGEGEDGRRGKGRMGRRRGRVRGWGGRGEGEDGRKGKEGSKSMQCACMSTQSVNTHTPWFSCHDFHRSSEVISRSVSWNRWLFSEPSCSSVWRNCRGREWEGRRGDDRLLNL